MTCPLCRDPGHQLSTCPRWRVRSNCLIWAAWAYARALWRWWRRGMPIGDEPYFLFRPSRLEPRWVPHFLVGDRDPDTGVMALQSYKPVKADAKNAPWYRLGLKLFFRGQVVQGD